MRRKMKDLLPKLIQLCSLIIGLLCLILGMKTKLYEEPIYLIPICYSITTLIQDKKDFNLPGIFLFKIILFWRYSLMPLFFYIANIEFRFVRNYHYLTDAIWLMLFEMISISLILKLTEKNNKNRRLNKEIKLNYQSKIKKSISFFLIFFIIVISLKYSSLLKGLPLLFGKQNIENMQEVPVIISMIYHASVLWIYMYTIFQLKIKKKNINWSFLISLIYVIFTFLGQNRISRWNTIITFLTVVFILFKLYPTERQKVILNVLLPSLSLIVILTIYKHTNYLDNKGSITVAQKIIKILNAETLNLYFGGPVNINSAIGTSKYFSELGFKTLFWDLLSGIPILNHYVNELQTSTVLFNIYIGRYFGKGNYDQIIPLVGQGYIYFSFYLAPLLSVLSVLLIRYFDKKFYYSKKMIIYIFAFGGIWTATAIILNLTIFISWIFIRVVPFLIFFKSIDFFEESCLKLIRRYKKK